MRQTSSQSWLPLAALAALAAAPALGQPIPSRSGGSGIMDLPVASVLERTAAQMGLELQMEGVPGQELLLAPAPISLAVGLGSGVEAGFAFRQGGHPGDPRPSPLLYTGALRLAVLRGDGQLVPSVAVDASVDRINLLPVSRLRAVASAEIGGRTRVSAYAGLELEGLQLGTLFPGVGAAAEVTVADGVRAMAEASLARSGALLGAGVHWRLTRNLGLSAGITWLPSEAALRLGAGITVYSPAAVAALGPVTPKAEEPGKAAGVPQFSDERPHFRLKVRLPRSPVDLDLRHVQYGMDAEEETVAPEPKVAPPAPAVPVPVKLLRRGQKGEDVGRLQSALVALGGMAEKDARAERAVFGPKTEVALKKWQKAEGLEPTGRYGPKEALALAKRNRGAAPSGEVP